MQSARLGSTLNSRALHSGHARIMSRIATGRAYTGGTTASRLCRRETRRDASCQGEDENRRFHKPLMIVASTGGNRGG
jgi:hypothetical protein